MDLTTLLYALGAGPFFASRPFLSAFLTAASLRFGNDLPLIRNIDFLAAAAQEPTWFTSDWCLLALAILGALEVAADKVPEAQEALQSVQAYLKPAVASLAYLGVVGATDAQFVEQVAGTTAAVGRSLPDYAPVLLLFGSTLFVGTSRQAALDFLIEADADDNLGIRRLISWLEDFWVLAGVGLLIVLPALVVGLAAAVMGLFWWIGRRLAAREEKRKTSCTACGHEHYRSALECPACHARNETPCAIGFFGQTLDGVPAPAPATHALHLASKRRCPRCATRLEKRTPRQDCPACGHALFADPAFRRDYLDFVAARLPVTLGVCLALGLLPILGLVIGIVYYRIRLVAPFRAYIPLHRSFFVRWALRLFFFLMMAFQIVPVAGAMVLPIMALVSYSAYRRSFVAGLPGP